MSRPKYILFAFAIAALTLTGAGIGAEEINHESEASWASIRKDTFGQQEMIDGKGLLATTCATVVSIGAGAGLPIFENMWNPSMSCAPAPRRRHRRCRCSRLPP